VPILLPFARLVAPKQRPHVRPRTLRCWPAVWLTFPLDCALVLRRCVDRRTVYQLAPAGFPEESAQFLAVAVPWAT
jgi:hypothetical protein